MSAWKISKNDCEIKSLHYNVANGMERFEAKLKVGKKIVSISLSKEDYENLLACIYDAPA